MSIESEMAVLASAIFQGSADPIQPLEPRDIFSRDNRQIYHAINTLSLAGATIDLPSVTAALERSGAQVAPHVVSDLSSHYSGNVDYHVSVLKDRAARYYAQRAANRFLAKLKDPSESVQEMVHGFVTEIKTHAVSKPIEEDSLEEVLRRGFSGSYGKRISTGFQKLDYLLEGGLLMGQYTLITGKTGHGKSTLANQIVLHLCSHDLPVWLGSFEMHPFRSAKNMMRQTGLVVDKKNIDAFVQYTRRKLYISGKGTVGILDPEKMAQEVEHYLTKRNVRFFVIDNLAVMEAMESGERLEKQTLLMQRVLRFCMEHEVHFFLLVHLRKTNGSTLSIEDVAGTSNIGNLAETALLIKRSTDPNYDAVLRILKARTHGFGKSIKLSFDERTGTFQEI